MAGHRKGTVTREMDTNVLFEKFTVDEIKDIEKKTRADIEDKKEELRLMVGERYRDLIEAADTITEMKHCAHNVTQSIKRMHEMCQKMKPVHNVGRPAASSLNKERNKVKEENQFYGLATQIKLLMDMPEKIWSAIDSESYLYASQLFLLARHIHTGLQLDSQQSSQILKYMPVLSRQWAAISHFRATILQSCQESLKESNISDQIAADCLCSILLLEDSTPRQVFNELLLIRTSTVQKLFIADQSTVTIKQQISDVVETIISTVHQIYALFYCDDSRSKNSDENSVVNNLLMKTLERVTDKSERGAILTDDISHSTMKHLPAFVKDFRPVLVHLAAPIEQMKLRTNCQQWINTCVQDVQSGVFKILTYMTSVKGLAAVRDEVWTLLNEDPKMKTWDLVCSNVLDAKLLIWDSLFQSLFINRTKQILQGQFDSALNVCKQQIGKIMTDIANTKDRQVLSERNLSHYIWMETSHDVSTTSAWISIRNKSLSDAGTLLMKSRAYTPAVQTLCKSFDNKLKTLREDASYYMKPENKSDGEAEHGGPFDKFADQKELETYLQSCCQDCVQKLLENLSQQLYACKQQLANNCDVQGNTLILDRVLLLGRFVLALSELCTNLHLCMIGTGDKTESIKLNKKTKLGTKTAENEEWKQIQGKLVDFSHQTFSMWSESITQHLVKQFSHELQNETASNILKACTQWDNIDIQEESEEGRPIKSSIKVPMQASWYVQSLVFELCSEINRIGGHALNRSVIYNLVEKLTEDLMSSYSDFLKSFSSKTHDASRLPMTQTRALQLLFDVKYLLALLPRKDESLNKVILSKSEQVIDKLESHVDPFDLDVFAPYIRDHLSRQSQRASVLLGALTSLDKQGSFGSVRPAYATQQEQHNVLPLVSMSNRLPLLPLSVQNRGSMPPPIVQSPKAKVSPLSSSSSVPEDIPTAMQKSASFFDNMSTIWFTNKKS